MRRRTTPSRWCQLPGIGTRYERPDVPADASREQLRAARRTGAAALSAIAVQDPSGQRRAVRRDPGGEPGGACWCCSTDGIPPSPTSSCGGSTRRCDAHGYRDPRAHAGAAAGRRTTTICASICVCDAMLDTLHWSGGNTSLDALACGLPIVTLPGPFMRGRQSAGMLSLLGVPELIARDRADYVAIATRLIARAGVAARACRAHRRRAGAPVRRARRDRRLQELASGRRRSRGVIRARARSKAILEVPRVARHVEQRMRARFAREPRAIAARAAPASRAEPSASAS